MIESITASKSSPIFPVPDAQVTLSLGKIGEATMPKRKGFGQAVIGKLEPQHKLAEFMAENGWTQEHLAEEVGVDRMTIHNIVAGKYRTREGIALAICEALEVEWGEVFTFRIPSKSEER